jgi:hypothetical protein
MQWVLGILSQGGKVAGLEADYLPPSSPEVKNAWNHTSTLPYVIMGLCLIKHRDNCVLIALQISHYTESDFSLCFVKYAEHQEIFETNIVALNEICNLYYRPVLDSTLCKFWHSLVLEARTGVFCG